MTDIGQLTETTDLNQHRRMLGTWLVAASSVRGSSHKSRDQPCQDAHNFKQLPNGILVAAVADGAGSASLSDIGAHSAVSSAVEAIAKKLLDRDFRLEDDAVTNALMSAVQTAQEAVIRAAMEREASPRDLATTLILLIAAPTYLAAAQVGDGATVADSNQHGMIGLTTPRCGEFVNEVTFLTSDSAMNEIQIAFLPGSVRSIAMLSDGLQMLCIQMPEGTPYPDFFRPFFRFISEATDDHDASQALHEFLSTPAMAQRADDDLTLLLASFRPIETELVTTDDTTP